MHLQCSKIGALPQILRMTPTKRQAHHHKLKQPISQTFKSWENKTDKKTGILIQDRCTTTSIENETNKKTDALPQIEIANILGFQFLEIVSLERALPDNLKTYIYWQITSPSYYYKYWKQSQQISTPPQDRCTTTNIENGANRRTSTLSQDRRIITSIEKRADRKIDAPPQVVIANILGFLILGKRSQWKEKRITTS